MKILLKNYQLGRVIIGNNVEIGAILLLIGFNW